LVAYAPLWTQITYRRPQAYSTDNEDVWDVEDDDLRDVEGDDLCDEYAPILGKTTCQQVARKNSERGEAAPNSPKNTTTSRIPRSLILPAIRP
jgi:hypothetical protein